MCRTVFFNFVFYLLLFLPYSVSTTKYCYQPLVPENGHVIFAEAGPYTPGTVARYSCALGFDRVGAEERVCQPNGRWSGQSPICAIDVAKNRPSEQASGGPADGPTKGTCSLSDNEANSWWATTLLGQFEVHAVVVRLGEESSPLLSIELISDTGDTHTCDLQTYSYSVNSTTAIRCRGSKISRVVITAESRLHLCAVHVFATNAVSAWQCAVGQMDVVGVFDGMCYATTREEKTDWKEAQGRCLDRGASLPIRMSPSAIRGLRTALSASDLTASFFWIGAIAGESEWRWADGQTVIDGEDDWPQDTATPRASYGEAVLLARPLEWKWIPAAQTAWNPFICQSKPKFCTSPGVGEAGRVVFSSHSYAIGTQCFYACEDGFHLQGNGTRECLEGGRWSGTIPRCTRLNCGPPPDWPNGSVALLNGTTLYGSMAEYTCSAGHETIGPRIRSCANDGLWDGQPPQCIPLDCGRPPPVAHSSIVVMSTIVNGSATYTCDEEYRLIGHSVVFCSEKAVWEPTSPICYDLTTLRELKGSGNSEGNAFLALLAVLLVALLVAAVIKLSRPTPGQTPPAPLTENNKYTPSPVQQVIYAAPTALPSSMCGPPQEDKVVYYATSAPLASMTHLEVPPQLLQLQKLPNGNIHVTLPLGRPAVRPPLPIFRAHSPTPSQLLYTFDHEPYYDVPPEEDEVVVSTRVLVPDDHNDEENLEENIYERLPDVPPRTEL